MQPSDDPDNIIEILKQVQWYYFYDVVNAVSDLNVYWLRFFKGTILEKGFSFHSNGHFENIGDTPEGTGKDHQYIGGATKIFLEQKFEKNSIYTPKLGRLKPKIKVTLKNNRGTTYKNLSDTFAQWLLVVDVRGAMVVKIDDVFEYQRITGEQCFVVKPDCIKLDAPVALFTSVFKLDPNEVLETTDYPVKDQIYDIMDDLVKHLKEKRDKRLALKPKL